MKKNLLTACCVFILGTLQLKAQLVAHYTFTNLSGTDVSGNNLNAQQGLLNNGGVFSATADHYGTAQGAVAMGGAGSISGGYYGVLDNSLLDFNNQLSIAMWIKPGAYTNTRKIVDKLDGWNTGNFMMDFYSGYLRFWVASGHVDLLMDNALLNTWVHVVATYDGANARLYINNTLAATAAVTGALATNASSMMIGSDQGGGTNFYGTMDDLRIFGNALSPADIDTLYNEPEPPATPSGCLISKWTFNGGSANDEVGTDNGVVSGAMLTADRFGNANQAYTFDGIDDLIYFDGSHFETADFSVSFWFKSPNHNYKTILQKWASGNGGFGVDDYPQGAYSNVYTASTVTRGVNVSAYNGNSVGDWHHVVITNRFNDSASFYFDGVLISSSNISFAGQTITGNPQLVLGASTAGSNNFTGDIDDVLIYNCALADTEITALYTEGGWGTPVTTGMDELSSDNGIQIYPNPATKVLHADVTEATSITVVNLLGKTIFTEQLHSGNNNLDVSTLPNGVYFIQSDKGSIVKFVKE